MQPNRAQTLGRGLPLGETDEPMSWRPSVYDRKRHPNLMADACVRLGGEPGLGQVTDLEQAVRGIDARRQAHLDERTASG